MRSTRSKRWATDWLRPWMRWRRSSTSPRRPLGLAGGAQPLRAACGSCGDRVVDAGVARPSLAAGADSAVRPAGHRRPRQQPGHLPLELLRGWARTAWAARCGRAARGSSLKSRAVSCTEIPLGGEHLELHAALAPAGGQHGHPADQPPAVRRTMMSPGRSRISASSMASAFAGRRRGALPQPAVLVEVAVGAAGQLPQLGQLRLAPLEPGLHAHHVAVGLVLREGQVEQVVGLVRRVASAPGWRPCCRSGRKAELSWYERLEASAATWSKGTNGLHSTTA